MSDENIFSSIFETLPGPLAAAKAWSDAAHMRMTYPAPVMSAERFSKICEKRGLVPFHAPSGELAGVFWPSPDTPSFIAVHAHGNASACVDSKCHHKAVSSIGGALVSAEYPGYGARPGCPDEKSIGLAVTFAMAAATAKFPGIPLLLAGESLGCSSVASALALSNPGIVQGIFLGTPYPDFKTLLMSVFPLLPPWMGHPEEHDCLSKVSGRPAVPVVCLLAENDTTVPVRVQESFVSSIPNPKKTIRTKHSHHSWMDDRSTLKSAWTSLAVISGISLTEKTGGLS